MHDRWALMSGAGEWCRDDLGKVQIFLSEVDARIQLASLGEREPDGGWTLEPFTLEDALEEAARSPFAAEGGL